MVYKEVTTEELHVQHGSLELGIQSTAEKAEARKTVTPHA
jgi:hypothetical protein